MSDPIEIRTLDDLAAVVDALISPKDPVEIRVGSRDALNGIPIVSVELQKLPTAAAIYGLPVRTDPELPPDVIEVRARDGSTLSRIERRRD